MKQTLKASLDEGFALTGTVQYRYRTVPVRYHNLHKFVLGMPMNNKFLPPQHFNGKKIIIFLLGVRILARSQNENMQANKKARKRMTF
jgi:hypothetical protein